MNNWLIGLLCGMVIFIIQLLVRHLCMKVFDDIKSWGKDEADYSDTPWK